MGTVTSVTAAERAVPLGEWDGTGGSQAPRNGWFERSLGVAAGSVVEGKAAHVAENICVAASVHIAQNSEYF